METVVLIVLAFYMGTVCTLWAISLSSRNETKADYARAIIAPTVWPMILLSVTLAEVQRVFQ